VFLGAHGSYFGLKTKYEKRGSGNPFIDPDGYKAYVGSKEAEFRTEWERQKKNPGSPKR
jgi:metallo-beta-lactamase class B